MSTVGAIRMTELVYFPNDSPLQITGNGSRKHTEKWKILETSTALFSARAVLSVSKTNFK